MGVVGVAVDVGGMLKGGAPPYNRSNYFKKSRFSRYIERDDEHSFQIQSPQREV